MPESRFRCRQVPQQRKCKVVVSKQGAISRLRVTEAWSLSFPPEKYELGIEQRKSRGYHL